MKRMFMLLGLLFILSYSQAQTIVSTTVQTKNALIEEFTGIHCGYCPLGHLSMETAIKANPGHVYGIAYHQGSYASPSTGEPDYRTSFGDAIAGQTGLTGYPAGTVSRHVFSGTATDLSYSDWGAGCADINSQTACVNLAIDVDINQSTRLLTVLVEAYYTSASAASTNYLNVALCQNYVKGPQSNYGSPTPYNPDMVTTDGQYYHQHMLRHLLTGQWGTAINTPPPAPSIRPLLPIPFRLHTPVSLLT